MIKGLVTTIIPVFNRPVLLIDAVDSVLNQTYGSIELILVDDGSTDRTPEVIRQLQASHGERVRNLATPRGGPGVAREAGRMAAQGEFIQYLDSDDVLLPRKFEVQLGALATHPDCSIAYGKTLFTRVGEIPSTSPLGRTGEVFDELFPSMLQSRWWVTNTPLYRRSLIDKIGAWQALCNEEDWEYDARAAALRAKLVFCDEAGSIQRSHDPHDHLCHQGSRDPEKLRDRAVARRLIYSHARSAGIGHAEMEMTHFARSVFLLARQCGAVDLVRESRDLLQLAQEASSEGIGGGFDLKLYKWISNVIGWNASGRLSRWIDVLRSTR